MFNNKEKINLIKLYLDINKFIISDINAKFIIEKAY